MVQALVARNIQAFILLMLEIYNATKFTIRFNSSRVNEAN